MSNLLLLIPLALLLGALGLAAFIWCLRGDQFDDLEGAAHRILDDEGERTPLNGLKGDGHSVDGYIGDAPRD
jgi:cbb3-type cytochrome oxidase maturation protein